MVLADETDDAHRVVTTVLELAGQDQPGLLADVTHLLTTNGCDVRSAAVRGSVLIGPDASSINTRMSPNSCVACIKLIHLDATAWLHDVSGQQFVCACLPRAQGSCMYRSGRSRIG